MRLAPALWGTILSLVLGWESLAFGQQQTPVSAANDTLTTTGEEAAPTTDAAGPTEMQADTTAALRSRRGQESMMYYMSVGVGSAINYLPDQFKNNYDPSFGLRFGGGVTRYNLRVGVDFSYSFFMSNEATTLYPNDLSILTVFGEVKYVPTGKAIRPYIIACGGYFRQWIVNADYAENVLGYGGGAGLELEIGKGRHMFVEGRHIQGRTRETERKANTELIPFTLGVVWTF